MKSKGFFLIIMIILISSCSKNKIESDIYTVKGLIYKPVCITFKSEKVGYAFCNGDKSPYPTEAQLANPNYNAPITFTAYVYKTSDGGNSWSQVNVLNNYSFYPTILSYKNKIFIKLIDRRKELRSYLVEYNENDNKIIFLNYAFERMGDVWFAKNRVFIDGNKKNINKIVSTDENLEIVDSTNVDNIVFMNEVCNFNNHCFVLTWANKLYDITNKKTINLSENKYSQINKVNNEEMLLFSNKKEHNKVVIIEKYNIKTLKRRKIKELKDYSIISEFKSNDSIIAGFVGNIVGVFTEYDLLYSLDKGETWEIYHLNDPNYYTPNCLIGNIMYIVSENRKIQKIRFENPNRGVW